MLSRHHEYRHICATLKADADPPAAEVRPLRGLLDDWLLWAPSVPYRDHFEGWEGTFPHWEALIQTAGEVMCLNPLPVDAVPLLEACWILSDECQEMQNWAKAHIQACFHSLIVLTKSRYPTVRWQVYVTMACLRAGGMGHLRDALEDPDAYCRRRAASELVDLCPVDHVELSKRIIDDPDEWTRRLAVQLRDCVPGT